MRLLRLVFKFPRSYILIVILFTLFFAYQIPDLIFQPDIKAMLPDSIPEKIALNELEDIFGGSEIIIVAAESENLLKKDNLNNLKELHNKFAEINGLDKVLSIFDAHFIVAEEDGFQVEELLSNIPQTEEEINTFKKRVLKNDLFKGKIVTTDFKTIAYILMLKKSSEVDDTSITITVENIINNFNNKEIKLIASGLPINRVYVKEYMQNDIKSFLPFGIILMILLLAVSFKSWAGVFLPLSVVIISIIWSIGTLALLKIEFVFIMVLMPVMLIAIANDYGIHIIARYFQELKQTPKFDKKALLFNVVKSLNAPVILTGVTTMIGFLSLLTHILPAAKHLGIIAAGAVCLALLLSLTFIPAALLLLDPPMSALDEKSGQLFNKMLSKWSNFFNKHAKPFVVIFLAIIVVVGFKMSSVIVDTNPTHYFDKKSDFRKATDYISKTFGGSTQLAIPVNGDIKSPEVLNKMKQVSEYLKQNELITDVISIVDQIEMMNQAFHGDDKNFKKIPESRDMIAQTLMLYSMTGDSSDLERYVDFNYENAQIIARINEMSSTAVYNLINDVDNYLNKNHDRKIFNNITGFGTILGVMVNIIVKGQMYSLILSLILVLIVTAIVFRSFLAGILCIVPLFTAIILVFGLMGIFGIELNLATAMLSSIMIGVGIDYTIHFLWHYKENLLITKNWEQAVTDTISTSGKGIIYNAMSVIIGFLVLMLSNFVPVYFFGFLVVFSIGMCLFGALAFLPAILVIFKPSYMLKGNRHADK